MSDLIAVHHPVEPQLPAFDFWIWRLYRRLTIDRLLALSAAGYTPLKGLANAMEIEELSATDLEDFYDLLDDQGIERPDNMREMFLKSAELTERMGVPVESHWQLPALTPTWDDIPVQKVVFDGSAGGTQLRARLEPTESLVPAYEVLWDVNGDEEPSGHLLRANLGIYLPYGKAVWDWLFTRRLTILAQAGSLEWPVADAPPILLSAEFMAPARAV